MMRAQKLTIAVLTGLLFGSLTLLGAANPPGWPEYADAVVAPDGGGQFASLQAAIDAAPTASAARPWVIAVKPGVYKELIYVMREKRHLRIVGEDAEKTVITYDLNARMPGPDGKPIGTFRTASAVIDADDFTAENLTFENSFGTGAQALAVRLDGDRAAFRECRFLGWQDTILANRGRHYFEDCFISGHVDFIFGAATAFFERCHIRCRQNGYITAASTPETQLHGFVFSNCTIDGETPDVRTYLGRPWRAHASVTFLHTTLSEVVRPEGWDNWRQPAREKTARYAEHGSTGPGAAAAARVSWARRLGPDEAGAITAQAVLGGVDGWNPAAAGRAAAPQPVVAAAPGSPACMPPARWSPNVQYGRAAGESLRLDACLPPAGGGPPGAKGPLPAAILVHGGGWTGGERAKGVAPLFAGLTHAGVAWLSVDYRLAPKHTFPAAIEDVETAVRWVKRNAARLEIDPARLALVGESAGGQIVGMVAVRAQDDTRVAAIVPFYAPVDLEADTKRRGGLSASLRAMFGRTEVDDGTRTLLHEASPINFVRAGLPPFLLIHGTADMSVPYDQSTRLQEKLRSLGVACDLITIPDGVHGMGRWETLDPSYKDKVVTWIVQKLTPPAQDASPGSRR